MIFLFTPLCIAQNIESSAQNAEAVIEVVDSVALLEEITVVGERTFISMRNQLTRAEDNLYSLFDEFDIICREL